MTHESDPPARRRRVDPSLVGRLGPVARAIDGWKTRTLFPAFGVIPVERSGGSTAQAALPRPFRRVVVAFGEPIDPSVVHDRAGGGMAGGDLTDRVMFEIQRRSGQDHVDAY